MCLELSTGPMLCVPRGCQLLLLATPQQALIEHLLCARRHAGYGGLGSGRSKQEYLSLRG